MVDDWKSKAREKRKEIEMAERIRENREAELASQKAKSREALRQTANNLTPNIVKEIKSKGIRTFLLGLRFKCAVCGKQASKPEERGGGSYSDAFGTHWDPISYDWGKPGDLYRCDMCGRWICSEHIHAGICKRCAERS